MDEGSNSDEEGNDLKGRGHQPMNAVHLELWVSNRKDRLRMRRATKGAYQFARTVTLSYGGDGPWVFLVEPDPPNTKSVRLRNTMKVRPDEDLWLELAFYPDNAIMKKIIARIWRDKGFRAYAEELDSLISKRVPGYQGTVAYLTLQPI